MRFHLVMPTLTAGATQLSNVRGKHTKSHDSYSQKMSLPIYLLAHCSSSVCNVIHHQKDNGESLYMQEQTRSNNLQDGLIMKA